jgi:signal transduction histidine kinase
MDDQDIRLEQVDSGKYMDMIIEEYGLADTYTVPIKAGNDTFGYMRIVRKNREIQIMKDTFGVVIILGFTLSWALSLIFSYSIVKRISEPMTKLSRHLEKLKPDNMVPIVESPQMDRELSVVVASINNMIVRLRDNLKRERQITENISHEFKTPLTRIASNLQVGKVKEAEREVLELGGNVDALLSLAIWDQHEEQSDVVGVLKHLTKLIPSRIGIEIKLPKKMMTPLPHSHLQIIFRNLIDNAIKHNQKNGRIIIKGEVNGDKWEVSIQNTTSNEVLKSKMVERKYRKGESAGHGIGMSIVSDMCRMHGLKMEVTKLSGQMKVQIEGDIA